MLSYISKKNPAFSRCLKKFSSSRNNELFHIIKFLISLKKGFGWRIIILLESLNFIHGGGDGGGLDFP